MGAPLGQLLLLVHPSVCRLASPAIISDSRGTGFVIHKIVSLMRVWAIRELAAHDDLFLSPPVYVCQWNWNVCM